MNAFNENNIILRFGVISDVHISGSWNQPRSVAKLAHAVKVFQRAAGQKPDGSTRLDALLVNGDFIDAVNSIGNVNKDFARYGNKLTQNVREIGYVADCTEGRVGQGLNDDVRFFYALGNHDESGRGRTGYNPERAGFPAMHSAAIFAAIFCGWQCRNFEESNTEFEDYTTDLMALAASPSDAGKAAFAAKYAVDAEYALSRWQRYFGCDIGVGDEHGLLYGNRHMKLGDIHFAALETSCSPETAAWFEEICRQSVSENPKKPIFVLTHYRVVDTIFLSGGGTHNLDGVLAKYPQVVIWAGHTHTPLFLETAIDQSRGFTAVESAVTAYLSNTSLLSIGGETGFPYNLPRKESHNFGNGCYVEVDGDYNVRINRLDLYRSYSADYAREEYYRGIGIYENFEEESWSAPSDEAVFLRRPWVIGNFDRPQDFAYTRARADRLSAPRFPEDAQISAEITDGGILLSFDAAVSGDMVFRYHVELRAEENVRTYELTTFPHMYIDPADMPRRMSVALDAPAGCYDVTITAIDAWEQESEPLCGRIMQTYLFDFDGTLVDSMPAFVSVMLRILDEHNIKYGDDIVKIITPLGYIHTAKYFRELGVDKTEEEIIGLMYSYAIDQYANHITEKPHVIDTLRTLHARGCSLNVLTASPHIMLDPCLKRMGIFDLFDHVWSCEDFGTTKTDPAIYRMAAERIGAPVGDILFLDDNLNADKTAKAAGMRVVGVYDDSSRDYAEEMRAVCDRYIINFGELL
ncbi:MAG: HAD-IA family hydrolase [Clostridia bacterium]|nr:HAD-IA family hydrolase [Clostridia bacterium]